MEHIINSKWNDTINFTTDIDGHKITVDADEQFGGQNKGPSPKKLLLAGLAGCTGMDVISILKKMHINPKYFNIKIQAELSEGQPSIYKKFHIIYEVSKNVPSSKMEKAVSLSVEKYCGVHKMFEAFAEVTHEIAFQE